MVGKENCLLMSHKKLNKMGGGHTKHRNVKRRQALTTGHTRSRSNPGLASQQLRALEQLTVLSNVQPTAVHFISLKTQLNFP